MNALFEKIENSKSLDFGDIFNKSIELFKKVWLQGFVHLLISILIMLPLFFVIYIPVFALAGMSGFESGYGDYGYPSEELSIGLMFLFVILVLVIAMIASALQFGITAHFYRVCKQVDLGLPETSSYFMFLKGKYLGKVFALAIATFGIAILAATLCYLPIFYVMVPLQLLGVIFAFNPEYSASDLIKASFKLGNKIWGISFGLIIVASILSQMVGMVLCFVGIFFTASFVYMPIYFIYKGTLGFEDDEFENKETLFVK
ncbi:hypothetical protein ATE84_0099 [Aquimarina sp. MAR_2010_214]|uniref:hypothetical protein n=1 Tax=Aquimarina sp. MAR_2010_214 TaxID=1250026 RepID=UPI000C70A5F0|nr:hypothetical protein [Aquimarina sp. MAR_2010_214]PKV48110.1 hypothetical protein ATE84_0099 [Aquimarina sp. MAR_2010_214]